ncbi:hypothetical protein [Sphingomonas sp.]|uniref:hypothetical protein n=1 Tax=Sphingomonas sp. TaxID=28214 RepID=UPI00286DD6A5|nr:hypothetical protein [Sphingomonas sp.]
MFMDPNQAVIYALIFILGLLIGGFLFSGGGRKWKHRYRAEVDRREELERTHRDREAEYATREKEWREQDSLRAAAIKSPRDPAAATSVEEERRLAEDRRVEEDRRRAARREDDRPL